MNDAIALDASRGFAAGAVRGGKGATLTGFAVVGVILLYAAYRLLCRRHPHAHRYTHRR